MTLDFYPPITPHATGWLDVGDPHRLYWEVSGNPDGAAVLFLHGGPGAAVAAPYRRFFDPAFWRIVLFDQRGCGRSTPNASVEANTTADLIADMEKLRRHLGIERWLLFGGSWGSTLALAYGQAHPDRVAGFVLRGIFLFRPQEVAWFLDGMGLFFPEARRRLVEFLPEGERGDLLGAYYRRLLDFDPAVNLPAAQAWCAYEDACARLLPRAAATTGAEAGGSLSLARIECHYMVHGGFLAPGQLLGNMNRIAGLPATIVQGRYDMVCPPATAVELADSWPGSRLTLIPDAGHSAMEPGTRAALIEAVEAMKGPAFGA